MTVLEKIKRCVSLVWDFQEIYGEEDIEDFCRNELRTYPQHDEIMEYFKHIENLEKNNEWHYPSKGEYPKDEKNFQSYVVAYYGAIGSIANGKPCWEELCYDTENKRWVDKETLDDIPYVNQEGIVIAWRKIVLPKEN